MRTKESNFIKYGCIDLNKDQRKQNKRKKSYNSSSDDDENHPKQNALNTKTPATSKNKVV